MTAADTWTGRLLLFDRAAARLDLLPRSAAMPADLGPTSFARGLVIPFSHEPLDPERAELFELSPTAEGLALVATAEARKSFTARQFAARLRSRFGREDVPRAIQDEVRDELLAEADPIVTGHTGLLDLETGIALLPEAQARDEWIRNLLQEACGIRLDGLTTPVIPALLSAWALGESPIPPPFRAGHSIALESALDKSKSAFEGCLATSDDIRAQIVEYERIPVRMALRHADVVLEVRDPFAIRVEIEHSGLRGLRKEAANPSSAAQHRAYLQALAPRIRPVLTWVATHFTSTPDTARWQHPAGGREDLLGLLGSHHDELPRPSA